MCRLIYRKGIRYYFAWAAYCLSSENGKGTSLKSVTKIRHPKILKWKKKKINKNKTHTEKKNKNKKNCQPQGIIMTPACAFSMNQSVGREATHIEGKGA